MMKTIGVLTSGGDAPGMNAAVRSVARSALAAGIKVYGIKGGYYGLINDDIVELNMRSVSDVLQRAGTFLYSARCLETCKKYGIEGIVVVGGDGSFRGARDLSLRGIPCVAIPATIDNDISSTEYALGFDTAMNTCMEMVDKLRDTIQSHDRCSVVEVMGRDAGHLALHTGIAVGATSVIVPEIPFDFKRDVLDRIAYTQSLGKKHFIIVVAEGVGGVHEMAKEIQAVTGIDTRATVLGHVQRGGSPTVKDRYMASLYGNAAVELLKQGIGNRVVAYKESKIVDYDIFEALNMKKPFDFEVFEIGRAISI